MHVRLFAFIISYAEQKVNRCSSKTFREVHENPCKKSFAKPEKTLDTSGSVCYIIQVMKKKYPLLT